MIKDFLVEFCGQKFECVDKGFKYNEPIDVIIRPEDIYIMKEDNANVMIKAEVQSCVFKGDHFQTTALMYDEDRSEILIHDNVECTVGEVIGLYIKPFDLHIMHKARIINTIITEMWDKNIVEICEGKFPCNADYESGTKVKVTVDFDDVELFDNEEDGIIGGVIVNSIYKGSYYQCLVRTDTYYDFFVDTEDDWLVGDRVGISIKPEKLT
jgi:ABC-type spermidine/putrescine transport systems, ATPase components